MPYTDLGRNAMLDAIDVDRAGLFTAEAGKAFTAEADDDTLTSNAHGYANGDLVVLSALTPSSGTGLDAGQPYYVINQAANTFKLARTTGGAAVAIGTDLTAGTVKRLVEWAGGAPAYSREVIAFAAAAGGVADDSSNGVPFDAPAGSKSSYVGYWNFASGELRAIDDLVEETFAGQGVYTLNDAKLDLNAA